jgi:hypothetical protein
MSALKQNQADESISTENQWKNIYLLGGITGILVLIGVLLDTFIGTASGGNLSTLPQTAVDRFAQFADNPWSGLYHLDLLNMVIQIISIPTYFAIYAAHRNGKNAYVLLGLLVFLVGTAIFVTTNTALPMYELSLKYAASSEPQKSLLAAAGEAMLARGAHGTTSVFIGFLLPSLAGIIMSLGMLTGKVFSKTTSYLGLVGGILISIYLVLVTFVPQAKSMATLIAMPGGLLLIAWMVMYNLKLFQLGKLTGSQA